jgi:signal transduction histidine kinase
MHGLSLRARLLVVLAVALLPLAALFVWSEVRQTTAAANQARTQLRFAASLLAAHEDRAVDAAEQLLGAIANMPQLRTMSREGCWHYFQRLREEYPAYANLGLVDPQGSVLCHALDAHPKVSVQDRDYFQQALAKRTFVMGAPIIGRFTERPSLPFALPVMDGGRVVAVVYVALDLLHASQGLGQVDVPPGARVTVADRHGHILMEYPGHPGRKLLRTSRHAALLEAVRTMQPQVGEGPDLDGERRIFAFAPGRSVGGSALVVRVTLSSESVSQGAWVRLREELAIFAAMVLAALAAVWWIGGRMVVNPARDILATVRRMEQGQLDARVPLDKRPLRGEFARIGAAFNLMANALQSHQADLVSELGRSRSAYAVLDEVLNSMQEGLAAIAPDGRILLYNRAAAGLFPLEDTPKDVKLWIGHFGIHPPDSEALADPGDLPLLRAARGESEGKVTFFVRNRLVPEGRLVQCTWHAMTGEAVRGLLVMFTDVTELNAIVLENTRLVAELQELNASLESRIAERTEQLRATNQELEAFSYSVSHDLRAPLAAISGFSAALQEKLGGTGDGRALHYLTRIQAGVRKMEELIEAMLQLSRVVRAPLEWRDVDLSALARDALDSLRQQSPGRRVDVRIEEGLVARGDPRLLRIAIENLVGNAWKFTSSREQALIEVGRADTRVFFVSDNGVGFDMAYAGKLFTAFHRLHTEAEFPGTGIGLATVRRVIARHYGRVWAESQPGERTTFYFAL